MDTPPPLTPSQPVTARRTPTLVVAVAAVALIAGGIGGGILGVLGAEGKLGNWLASTANEATNAAGPVTNLTVQESSATVDVVTKVNDAVVSIVGTKDFSKLYQDSATTPFEQFFGFNQAVPQGTQQVSSASGFIITSDGLILTNKHVISDAQADYTVVLNDKRSFPAKVLAQDPVNDVAILKVEATDLPTVPLGDSDSVQVGQSVVAIGNALGQYRNTVTSGIISGKARSIEAGGQGSSEVLDNVFQTDAAINPGNSGGPLLDLAGSAIAMNTAINTEGQLIGFAIPINVAKRDVESVQKTGTIEVAYLGVCHTLITSEVARRNSLPVDHGALITKGSGCDFAVAPGSPADKAGLVENDVITAIDGTAINGDTRLTTLLQQHAPGDTVTLTVSHDGEEKTVSVTLGKRE